MPKGIKGFVKGHKHSPETIEKLKIAAKNQKPCKHTEEFKKRVSERHKGKIVSEETRLKMSLAKKGKPNISKRGVNSYFWKGGITPINKAIRGSLEYKLWRTAVFERDNYQCIWGGKEHSNRLEADHIKPFALFPELRFAIDNGRTLCKDCHKLTDSYGLNQYNKKNFK